LCALKSGRSTTVAWLPLVTTGSPVTEELPLSSRRPRIPSMLRVTLLRLLRRRRNCPPRNSVRRRRSVWSAVSAVRRSSLMRMTC
ncbi:hypothetical protein DFQ28_007967, partial [Apophysomyces sp. BC1034]